MGASRLRAAVPAPNRIRLLSGRAASMRVAISFLLDHQHARAMAVDRRRLRNRRETSELIGRHFGEAIFPNQKIRVARLRATSKVVDRSDFVVGIEGEVAVERSDVIDWESCGH